MLSNLPILSLIGLASLQTIRSQFTTVTIFPDDNITSLQGQIEGTGKDGTTYVVSGFISTAGTTEQVTGTVVEDATHLSEVIVAATAGNIAVILKENCNYNSQHEGVCTGVEELVAPTFTLSSVVSTSGVLSFDPVVLPTAKSAAASVSHSVFFLSTVPLLSLGLGLLLLA